MATLLVSAAVNIGAGLLLGFLFPPKGRDQVSEGPRLNDLTVTSSAYGQPINIGYGTARMGGNVIWSRGIEEVANTQTQSAGGKGGGGGGSVSQTTFTYFASFAIGFAEGEAEDVLRIWGDGKLIYDKTGSGIATSKGLKFRFYRGDETQLPDALIEAAEGAGNVPAHRGMCYLVAERWPLADFGNRIPQITAEITFRSTAVMPFTALIELPSQNIPGSITGADASSHMFLDPFSDSLYFLKTGSAGVARVSVGSFSTQVQRAGGGLSSRTARYCTNGKIYIQDTTSSNFERFLEVEPNGMQFTGFTFGVNFGLGTWGNPFQFPNGSEIGVLQVGVPAQDLLVISANTILGNGGFVVVHKDQTGALAQTNHLDTDIGRGGRVIQDFFNNRVFVTQENDTTIDVWEVLGTVATGTSGSYVSEAGKRLVGSYSKGGAQYSGTSDTNGWCLLPDEEALILSNGASMFKIDMDSGAVLAVNLTLGFRSEDQWTNTGRLGFGNGASGNGAGIAYTIETDDLTVRAAQDLDLAGFGGSDPEANYFKAAYDPRSHSLIYSRVHGSNPASNRVVRILLERGTGLGEDLDLVVADLCLRSGLVAGEFDVVGLAGQIVRGYVVNRQGSARSAIEPLQRGFLFEGVETDWRVKFVPRGGSPVLTVTETDLGRLSLGSQDEFVKETRAQEVELPEVFSVIYSDKEKDYQQGHQRDKRVSLPTPTQSARNTVELSLPIVYIPTEAKQLAQRWLYTSWAERLALQSALPWRYIRLDPTDVFELPFRGETRRLRMAGLETGADLSIDFTATQEDSRSNDSSAAGDGGSGHLNQVIPSGLPTRLHLLDLPLLTANDAGLQLFSRAYWAASGYDNTWPGSLLFHSRDSGASFQEISSAPVEAAWGFVVGTLPDAATTFAWDESVTVDVTVARGFSRFQTATDDEVLNGANALAVTRADGLTEIVQFATVTPLDVSTVRLSRLLRGRRGTEDLTGGHGVSERAVLLEVGRTFRFQLDLGLLNAQTQYKGVTLNTHLEDAPTIPFTYTGQDLTPYSVVEIAATRPGGDLSLTWVRRTRFGGEMLDGTDDVPLNEASELYEVDFYDVAQPTPFLTRTGLTSPATTLTVAEYNTATGGAVGSVPTIEVKIYQVSAIVGRGRSTRTSI